MAANDSSPPIPGNSLNRAQEPCHNCSELSLDCDGQRPKCFVCMQKQIPCRGYKLDLSWQPGLAARGNLRGISDASSSPPPGAAARKSHIKNRKSKDLQFKFVTGKPVKRRKTREQTGQGRFNSRITSDQAPVPAIVIFDAAILTVPKETNFSPPSSSSLPDTIIHEYGDPTPAAINPDHAATSPSPMFDSEFNFIFPETLGPEEILQESNYALELYGHQDSILDPFPTPTSFSHHVGNDLDNSNNFNLILPSPIMFESLADKFHGILAQYDQQICVIPLTSDCNMNPFRIRKESSSGSQFLLHAILATSVYHLTQHPPENSSLELVERHRSTALNLFSIAVGKESSGSQGVALLDTALLLMYLDAAQSAKGMFNVHLDGVRSIIDMAGGPDMLIPRMPKLRAQLAMFIWCDTTIALISRDSPTLPVSYLGAILRHGKVDGWDYFHLSGCREEFVIAMVKLAKLAMQNEKAQDMEWLTFNTSGVDEVEEVIDECSTSPPLYDEREDEEALAQAQDRYHCEEAWRTGLLLYIARVFRWDRTGPVPGKIRYMARIVLDHVRSIRRTSTMQKQLLLPVYLAASEIQTDDYRQFTRGYCDWWTKSCGFKMFSDVSSFLEEVWKEQDNSKGSTVWWATVVDRRKQDSQLQQMPQILMG